MKNGIEAPEECMDSCSNVYLDYKKHSVKALFTNISMKKETLDEPAI